jgi:hypothetical protein
MLMLGIATILQQLKDICFKVLSFVVVLTHKLHLKTIGAYLITQVTQYVQLIKLLLVQTWLKISPLLAHYLTTVVLLIKAGFIVVLRKVGQLGLKLQTIALKTLQRVKQVLKLGK